DDEADPLPLARAARGQPLHQDQAPDRRRAAAGDLPLHLRLRRRARVAHRQAQRDRLRRVRDPGADHDGLGDERVRQQLVVDPPAEVPALDRRPALVAGLAGRAAARVLLRRLPARGARRAAHLRRVLGARGRPGRARARAAAGAVPRRLLLRAARRARRGAGGAVRRRLVRPDLRPAAADLPRRRLLLGVAAPRAVPDAHPVQPRLLHDRARPLRVPGLRGDRRRPLAPLPGRRDLRAVRPQLAALQPGLQAAGV
ncbi:MAG: ABC-2 type transporter, partial [uncultured Solirubrobacteraceae bacterium]